MKIVQIVPHPELKGKGIVHCEYPQYASLGEAQSHYDPEVVMLVEAPDYVFPQWVYDYAARDLDRFSKPVVHEGQHYNPKRGYVEWDDCLHDEKLHMQLHIMTPEQILAQLEDQRQIIDEKIAAMQRGIKARLFNYD